MRFIGIISMVIILSALCSCKKHTLEVNQLKYVNYFCFPQSQSITFQVDSFLFKKTPIGLDIDTVQYILYEEWSDSSIVFNDTCYSIRWKAMSLDTLFDNNFQGQKRYCINEFRISEWYDNVNITSFIMPPFLYKNWDGLASFNANTYTEIIRDEPIQPFRRYGKFSIQSINDSLYLDGELHKNLVKVVHVNIENAIEKRFSYSLWKENIGLLYSEKWILDTQKISNESWTKKAEKGYIITMKRIL